MKVVTTEAAPRAIGPYSQGVIAGNLIFVSGQLPIDPKTGQLLQGEIGPLARQVLLNIEAILKAAGSSLDQIVRTDIFLVDLKRDFAAMNEEYGKWITKAARQTVQVAALPLGSPIEISAIAYISTV